MVNIFGLKIDIIWLLILSEFLGGVIFGIAYFIYNKNRFDIYLCEKYLDTYRIKKKIKKKLEDKEFSWGKTNGFKIDFTYAIMDTRNKPVLYYNYLSAEPIKPFKDITNKIDSATFKILMDGKVLSHMGSRKNEKMLVYVIGGLILAIVIIGVYSLYNQQTLTNEIIRLTNRMINITMIKKDGIIIP